jgi:hypothetical protein
MYAAVYILSLSRAAHLFWGRCLSGNTPPPTPSSRLFGKAPSLQPLTSSLWSPGN